MDREIDEPIEITPHDPRWAARYARDAAELRRAMGERLRGIEHFGSTAVSGLLAKPIIDVLVAPVEWPLHPLDRRALEALGYEHLGEAGVAGREYFRRRVSHATNLAVVELGGALWNDNLAIRDYLRAHPEVARRYGEEKQRAWEAGARTLLRYSAAKSGLVAQLAADAKRWRGAAT